MKSKVAQTEAINRVKLGIFNCWEGMPLEVDPERDFLGEGILRSKPHALEDQIFRVENS